MLRLVCGAESLLFYYGMGVTWLTDAHVITEYHRGGIGGERDRRGNGIGEGAG